MTPALAAASAFALVMVLGQRVGGGLGALTELPRVQVPRTPAGARPDGVRRWRTPLTALAALGAWAFVGGWIGVVVGGGCAALAWRALDRVEPVVVRRRREQVVAGLPLAVHLIAAALEAGAPVEVALRRVGDALDGVIADDLSALARRYGSGESSFAAPVSGASDADPWEPLLKALARSRQTGAPVAAAVAALSARLRAQSDARAMQVARTVEVRAAAPLGLCFLPAFVLLGVVPMVAGTLSGLRLLG